MLCIALCQTSYFNWSWHFKRAALYTRAGKCGHYWLLLYFVTNLSRTIGMAIGFRLSVEFDGGHQGWRHWLPLSMEVLGVTDIGYLALKKTFGPSLLRLREHCRRWAGGRSPGAVGETGKCCALGHTQPLHTNSQKLQLPAQAPHRQIERTVCRPSKSQGHVVWHGPWGNRESEDGLSKPQGVWQSRASTDNLKGSGKPWGYLCRDHEYKL